MVEHGVGGLLAPPGDVAALAAAAAALLTDAPRRRAMGRAAAAHAAKFDWERSGALMLGGYFAHAAPAPRRTWRGRSDGRYGGPSDGHEHTDTDGPARPPPPVWEQLHAWWLHAWSPAGSGHSGNYSSGYSSAYGAAYSAATAWWPALESAGYHPSASSWPAAANRSSSFPAPPALRLGLAAAWARRRK